MPLFTPELEFSDDYPTIEPSLRLNFANARALDPRITFTRNSIATYVDKDGLIKTAGVNEPRFDHDPATGESLGLLIEEERTNLLAQSEALDDAAWAKTGSLNPISANAAVAPDGNQTADVPSDISTKWGIYDDSNNSWISGYPQVYPFTVTSEWTRQSLTFTAPAGCTSVRFYVLRTQNDNSYVYDNATVSAGTTYTASAYYKLHTDGTTVLAWGVQVEEGSFPTSYIPTSGSTVTREKEFPVIETSTIDFKDFSQGGEGTLVCEFSNAGAIGSDIAVSFSGDTHNGATFVGLGTNSNRHAFNRVRVNATNTVLSTDTNFTTTGFYKVAFGIGQSRCTLAVRGSSSGVVEDTSVSYDSTPYTKLILGCDQTTNSSNNMINGTIKSVFYYSTLLTDTQLQTLTQ